MSQNSNSLPACTSFESARLELARLRMDSLEAKCDAAKQATKLCAIRLDVERVGIWLLDESEQHFECVCLYNRSSDTYEAGQIILVSQYPTYCQALLDRRTIVANDAPNNEFTGELKNDYLLPLGITSMLDAPIFRDGRLAGIVCSEHVGAPRKWSQAEVDFVASVADIFAVLDQQLHRLRLESELKERAQRAVTGAQLEMLERISAAVAHDLNNVLGSARLAAELIQSKTNSPEILHALESLHQSIAVGTRLTDFLFGFAERGECDVLQGVEKRNPTVADVVTRLQPMLETLAGKGCSVRIDGVLPAVSTVLSARELEQIILNLAVNAFDATHAIGGAVCFRGRLEDRYYVLEMEDNGGGIEEAVLEKMWTPHFTTKSNGSGIGLTTVASILEQRGGYCSVQSKDGEGTCFRIYLPRNVVCAEPEMSSEGRWHL